MSQTGTNTPRIERRTEDGDTNVEQQHAGLHTPADEPAGAAESGKVEGGRKVSDSQHVTMPEDRSDDDEKPPT